MDLSFIHHAIQMLQQHEPWVGDKLGGALVTQSLKELWDQVKTKLGSAATEKIETQPDDMGRWEVFKAKLLVALDEDPAFRQKVCDLTEKSKEEAEAAISQTASGTDIRQVAVHRSQGVNISIKRR